jgi:pterin-4a-carbinolamine dehydratase
MPVGILAGNTFLNFTLHSGTRISELDVDLAARVDEGA